MAFQSRTDVDLSYVRCMKVLLNGAGYPMLATHDPRLIDIAGHWPCGPTDAVANTSTRCSTACARTSSAGWRPR